MRNEVDSLRITGFDEMNLITNPGRLTAGGVARLGIVRRVQPLT
jgi:hypothetical protein